MQRSPKLLANPKRLAACLAVAIATGLTGCGLVGVMTATATDAAAEAEQAKQAKQIEQQVQQQLDLDAKLDRARLEQGEKDTQ